MPLLSLEHTANAYRLDFLLYAMLNVAVALVLVTSSPWSGRAALLLWAAGGIAAWSLLEYLLHRFVLHGLAPFSHWHSQHHLRPKALMAAPIGLSLSLFVILASLPAWWLVGGWPALALTQGLLLSYLGYGLVHHATHHKNPTWLCQTQWMRRRRICHAMHHANYQIDSHGDIRSASHFGATSSFWDMVFCTGSQVRPSGNSA